MGSSQLQPGDPGWDQLSDYEKHLLGFTAQAVSTVGQTAQASGFEPGTKPYDSYVTTNGGDPNAKQAPPDLGVIFAFYGAGALGGAITGYFLDLPKLWCAIIGSSGGALYAYTKMSSGDLAASNFALQWRKQMQTDWNYIYGVFHNGKALPDG